MTEWATNGPRLLAVFPGGDDNINNKKNEMFCQKTHVSYFFLAHNINIFILRTGSGIKNRYHGCLKQKFPHGFDHELASELESLGGVVACRGASVSKGDDTDELDDSDDMDDDDEEKPIAPRVETFGRDLEEECARTLIQHRVSSEETSTTTPTTTSRRLTSSSTNSENNTSDNNRSGSSSAPHPIRNGIAISDLLC